MIPWVVASVALKLSVCLATAAATGGIFTVALIAGEARRSGTGGHLPGHHGTLLLCVAGLFLSGGYFFVRVGDFAGGGIAGMLDPALTQILWESPVGSGLRYRLAGFTLAIALLVAVSRGRLPETLWPRCALIACYAVTVGLLALAFSVGGHSAEHGLTGRSAITIHVLMALWWAGSLYPLWRATGSLDPVDLQRVLHRFGAVASGLLLLLVLAGGALLYVLVFAPAARVSCAYATAIISKLALVGLLFCIAALHRWRSVPRVLTEGGRYGFRRSLALEFGLMLAVLSLTAFLTTAIGPYAS